jgi:hypothetical protein
MFFMIMITSLIALSSACISKADALRRPEVSSLLPLSFWGG